MIQLTHLHREWVVSLEWTFSGSFWLTSTLQSKKFLSLLKTHRPAKKRSNLLWYTTIICLSQVESHLKSAIMVVLQTLQSRLPLTKDPHKFSFPILKSSFLYLAQTTFSRFIWVILENSILWKWSGNDGRCCTFLKSKNV